MNLSIKKKHIFSNKIVSEEVLVLIVFSLSSFKAVPQLKPQRNTDGLHRLCNLHHTKKHG